MNARTTVLAAVAAGLLLTACSGQDSTDDAKASASPKTPTASISAAPIGEDSAKDSAEKTLEDFEKSLKDIDDALGETLGVQEGTYEVTSDSPDYEDPTEALDDEYLNPGTYTTKGPADSSYKCYWAQMADGSGDSSSIIANDLTAGRAIVVLQEGEYFKTSGCKPWTAPAS
ncbi:hypothetical protein AB0G64_11020 [Streptomyces longwoodensis]|uniref:hypothetical protein n=1 Tax=Streptomyces longwoodensis TaxID=68231 RepID=UPI003408866D